MSKNIDLTPSWEAAVTIYVQAAIFGTDIGQRAGIDALYDIGKLLDRIAQEDPELFTKCREGLKI